MTRELFLGGIGAALLVVVTGVTVCFCLMRLKRLIRRASDTASSVPSPCGTSVNLKEEKKSAARFKLSSIMRKVIVDNPRLTHVGDRGSNKYLLASFWKNLHKV